MTKTTMRRARRRRMCGSCLAVIHCGDRYLAHVASPNHLGNAGWWRTDECAECATRYGRGPLVVT